MTAVEAVVPTGPRLVAESRMLAAEERKAASVQYARAAERLMRVRLLREQAQEAIEASTLEHAATLAACRAAVERLGSDPLRLLVPPPARPGAAYRAGLPKGELRRRLLDALAGTMAQIAERVCLPSTIVTGNVTALVRDGLATPTGHPGAYVYEPIQRPA